MAASELEVVSQASKWGSGEAESFLFTETMSDSFTPKTVSESMWAIAGDVERRDHFAISGRADHEMNVRGAVAVAFLRANHVADRAIHRNHVAVRA